MMVVGIGQRNFQDLQLIKPHSLHTETSRFEELLFRRIEQHFINASRAVQVDKGAVMLTKSEQATEKNDFVKTVWPYATKAAKLLGLDPKILVAQAALETGWGQFIAKDEKGRSSNNLFNLKALTTNAEDAIVIKTTEFVANVPIQVKALFRKYSSIEDSFDDYVSFLKENKRYEEALAHAYDPERYIIELSHAGYASDPSYAAKILAIYHSDKLKNREEINDFSAHR